MPTRLALLAFALLSLLGCIARAEDRTAAAADAAMPEALFATLEWRSIGPFRGGRSCAVAGLPAQRDTYYFGSTGGGVWKTTDGGRTWRNVSDGFFGGSIGAVAVSESDPNVVYAGGGEKTVRGNVSSGDGVWKSVDAGKSWTFVGLADSRHVARIRIHPDDPELVYAAVMGHLFGPNEERGVYRSRDGGASWERILFANADAGAVDLTFDPTNPRILYASTWRVRRTPHALESGGEGSGLWKSTDGGDTWKELTRAEGLPREGAVGIIGVAVSRARPERIYAQVEHEEGGLFRSDDGGAKWTKVNGDRNLRQRAWYYTRVYADPVDADVVYVLNVQFHRSADGGRTFRSIGTPHSDNHDLWIDPGDPLRMIEGNDGGANVTTDGGRTWTEQNTQPTAQFYRVTTDTAFPYRIYGAQQDNSTVRIRSRSNSRGIGEDDWESTAGGESGHIAVDPRDPDVVYGGSYGGYLTRLNHRTGERRNVDVWPDNPIGWGAGELKYRFQWNFPIFFSPHDPGTLYAAGNVLFKTTNEGQSWQAISPDLTRDDKSRQEPSGGPITKDNTSVEYYCTIFAALESPHEEGVLWTGSDDGLVHVSRDGGASWADVTPPDLPEWSMINSLEAHPFTPGGLYLAATRYKLDDERPFLYRTLDYGASWSRIDGGLPERHFTRVVRADPVRRGLLYAGTERGVHVSFDDGARWQPLMLNLPVVPITDLAVKEGDLIAATQGRSFWVLDDLAHLRQVEPGQQELAVHLFAPEPTFRTRGGRGRGAPQNAARTRGDNPAAGVVFRVLLAAKPESASLEITDDRGRLVRRFATNPDEKRGEELKLELKAGMNRIEWDLTWPGATRVPGMILWAAGLGGPRAVPGAYQARLTVGDVTQETTFELLRDPRGEATADDMAAQLDYLLDARDLLTRTHEAILRIRRVRAQAQALLEKVPDGAAGEALRATAKTLNEGLKQVEEALYQTKNQSGQDPLNYPIRLNNKLAAVASLVAGDGDYRPTDQALAVSTEISAAIAAELEKLDALLAGELAALNAAAREMAILHVDPDPPGSSRPQGGGEGDGEDGAASAPDEDEEHDR